MKILSAVVAAVALVCLCVAAQANVLNMGAGLTNLETVTVGDAGNAGELSGSGAGGYGPDRICGSVGYNYSIGKYEVTAAQYCDFLNAKARTDPYALYCAAMWDNPNGCKIQRNGVSGNYTYTVASDYANRPVNYVSYWDACRFVNWVGNGQGNSDTETGAYYLNGYLGGDGRNIGRNAQATWAIASEDEWYKAAFYKGGGTNAGYWKYATQSDSVPSNVGSDSYTDPGNHANYYANGYTIGEPYYTTNAGEFENSASFYGTFDQGGNLFEWNEAILSVSSSYAYRGLRGSAFDHSANYLPASTRNYSLYSDAFGIVGFRVVQLSQPAPEPSSLIALAGGLLALVGMRRRRA